MNKVKFGIAGFDELLYGGIPEGSNILVYGNAGSGKTLLALEYLYRGATLYNEPGVFVSFDQSEKELIDQCEQLGWDIKKLLKSGQLNILALQIDEIDREFILKIFEAVNKVKAKRLAIDNLALLTLSPFFMSETRKFNVLYNNKIKVANNPRQLIYNLMTILKDIQTTTIYLTTPGEEPGGTSDGVSEYVCDGVIKLGLRSLGKSSLRTLEVMKMRRSDIKGGIHSFKITNNGIRVEE